MGMPRTNERDDANANAFTSPSALARRIAYDATIDALPSVARALAHYRETRESDAQRTLRERMARQNVGRYVPPSRPPTITPNDWEANAPRFTAKPPDRACHHPLVKCVHKW